jgi:hypothetical protein
MMRPEEFDEAEVHALFDDALRRRARPVAKRTTIDDVLAMALGDVGLARRIEGKLIARIRGGAGVPLMPHLATPDLAGHPLSTLDSFRPDSTLSGMPPREFVGPMVGEARLFPKGAISLFTALGGTGKTSALIAIAAHVAAGKAWGAMELRRERVLMFFVEEDKSELDRKFGAAVHDWTRSDRDVSADNLRLISLVGQDPRLTARMQKGVAMTPLVAEIAETALAFGAGLVVLDHLQGFADGDLNLSDTATTLASAASQIVAASGAAVVFAAHVNKSQIKAETVEAGITSGSLAFENAARQVTGLIRLPEGDAKALGMSDPENFGKLMIPKNNYGPAGQFGYLRREFVPPFHTIRIVPFVNVAAAIRSVMPRDERLKEKLRAYVAAHPGTTKNKIEILSGKGGRFGISKSELRRLLQEMLDDGALVSREVSPEEKAALGLPRQAAEVLSVPD